MQRQGPGLEKLQMHSPMAIFQMRLQCNSISVTSTYHLSAQLSISTWNCIRRQFECKMSTEKKHVRAANISCRWWNSLAQRIDAVNRSAEPTPSSAQTKKGEKMNRRKLRIELSWQLQHTFDLFLHNRTRPSGVYVRNEASLLRLYAIAHAWLLQRKRLGKPNDRMQH